MTILTWLHLTDWHQKGADFDRKVVRDKLLEDIRQRAERVGPGLAKVDFVVFSGDLACFAKKEEYQSAQKELLEPVLAALDLPPNRLFMVPGNHDFDRSAIELLPSALLRPLADNAAAHKWLAETLRPRTLEPFAAYREFVGALTGQASPDYASIQRLDLPGVSVALLGLNSAWMCARNKKKKEVDDKGHLLIGEPQIHDALTAIDDADLRIAVLHHPFEWLADFDREIVEDRLKEKCHFILHGHEHKQKVNISGGTGGECIVIPAGASYDRRVAANPRYVNAYNWVSLDLAAGKGVVHLRRWNEIQTKWQADADTCSDGCFVLDKLPKGLLIPPPEQCLTGQEIKPCKTNLKNIAGYLATAQATPATPPKVSAAAPGGKRIAILSANPIGEQSADAIHAAVLQEFNGFKCEISHFPLTTKALEALDGFHYIVVLTVLIKNKLVIEDDALQGARIGFKALEQSIGNGATDGVFIFLNHNDKDAVAAAEIADQIAGLALPTLILGALEKSQVGSLHFQLFKKANLDHFANSAVANRADFKLGEIKGVNKVRKNATTLPDAIDPKSTRHYIGRNTDLQNICRKIVDLRGRSEVLTIKGPGGIGKTATVKKIAVALAARKRFADGIDFIDCEFIPDHPAFVKKIAANFDLENAIDIKQHIKDLLDRQDRLIILDNLETLLHLPDRQPIMQFIEFICDYATIVVTTRELPGLGCEQVYELSRFSTDEATALFLRHCGDQPGDDATRRLIREQIVETLLDNNPLAITLVANNIPKGKSFIELQRELEDDIFRKASAADLAEFDSVADGNIERKKSLYASINFSYRHLSEAEKTALEILSLFPDGIDMAALKSIADKHRAALRKGAPAPAKPVGPIIGDAVIKALENKSMTQVDHHAIKLQSIVGKFAEYQLQQRDADQRQRHYRSAIAYNIGFAQALIDLMDGDRYRAAKTFNEHQANFFKSIDYIDAAARDAEDLLDYLGNLLVLANATTASGAFAQALEKKAQLFSEDAGATRCLALIVLHAKYVAGDFDAALARLKQILPLASLSTPAPGSGMDRMAMGIACQMYGMEGEALLELKWHIQTRQVYRLGYPYTLHRIGVIDPALLAHCKTDFFTLEARYASGALDNAMLDAHIASVYEKDHLELMQANYLKAKFNCAVRQPADAIRRDQARIKKLVSVNPYTRGLQQLMLAFGTVDVDVKIALFDEALGNLRHIHYYYVEALLLFARALRACGQPRYAEVFQKGFDLACRHHYRWLRHQFADLDQGRTTPYRADDLPLPEGLQIDGYVQFLIKWHKS